MQDERPTNTLQSSTIAPYDHQRQSTVGEGFGDSQLAFTKMTRESLSEKPHKVIENNQDMEATNFHDQNPLSTLKNSDLAVPTLDQQEPVKKELAAHCLSNLGTVE